MRRFVEEYLEQNGVLRQQLRTSIDMTSTEGIISAVEAGLGVGFVPCLALEKPLKVGSVKSLPLENGPIVRRLSSALLNGPEPKGPVGQLLQLLREDRAATVTASAPNVKRAQRKAQIVTSNGKTTGHKGAIS